jgi:hypothetical protein
MLHTPPLRSYIVLKPSRHCPLQDGGCSKRIVRPWAKRPAGDRRKCLAVAWLGNRFDVQTSRRCFHAMGCKWPTIQPQLVLLLHVNDHLPNQPDQWRSLWTNYTALAVIRYLHITQAVASLQVASDVWLSSNSNRPVLTPMKRALSNLDSEPTLVPGATPPAKRPRPLPLTRKALSPRSRCRNLRAVHRSTSGSTHARTTREWIRTSCTRDCRPSHCDEQRRDSEHRAPSRSRRILRLLNTAM